MRTIFVLITGYRGCSNAQPSPRGAVVPPGTSWNHDAAGVGLKRWRWVDWGRILRGWWCGRREVVDHARQRWQDASAKPSTRAITDRTPSFAPAVPHIQAPAVRFSALRVASSRSHSICCNSGQCWLRLGARSKKLAHLTAEPVRDTLIGNDMDHVKECIRAKCAPSRIAVVMTCQRPLVLMKIF